MSTLLQAVHERTSIAGENRMQLLLFKLHGKDDLFGINVFKVREVLKCPKLNQLPKSNKKVLGITQIRKETVSVIDLSHAVGFDPIPTIENSMLILTEYNKSVQGFAVHSVDNIVNVSWSDVQDPPTSIGDDHHLTAIARINDKLVNIIDVEDILATISPKFRHFAEENYNTGLTKIQTPQLKHKILIVDDSVVARKQLNKSIYDLGFETVEFKNGLEATNHVKELVSQGKVLTDIYDMIISDIEMPQMDGYTFVRNVRELQQNIHIILHTSLSGVFNQQLVEKVGANSFVAKFDPQILADEIQKMINLPN